MTLTKRYMVSQGNLENMFLKIIQGSPPEKYNVEHLKGLGFKSSNDRGFIPLLKDLGFLTSDGSPTNIYHEYRNETKSKAVLGRALLDTYDDIFSVNENPTEQDRKSIQGKFKTVHGSNDHVSNLQTSTFFSLLKMSDLDGARNLNIPESVAEASNDTPKVENDEVFQEGKTGSSTLKSELHYNIQIHLPATKEIEIYNSIFKSIKANLLDE